MPAPAVARDALAMATPVTDSVSPYRALKRQPTASLFFQGIVCSRANRDRSRQRCRLSIPSEEKCECGYSNNKSQFAHDGPLFLRRWGRTYTGEENELGHSPLGGHCKRKERRPKPTIGSLSQKKTLMHEAPGLFTGGRRKDTGSTQSQPFERNLTASPPLWVMPHQ